MPSRNLYTRVLDAYLYLFAVIIGLLMVEAIVALVIFSTLSDFSYEKSPGLKAAAVFWTVVLIVIVLMHIVLVIWRLVRLEGAKHQLRLVRVVYGAAHEATRDFPLMTVTEFQTLNGVMFQVTALRGGEYRIVINPAALLCRTYRLTRDSIEDVSKTPLGISPSQLQAMTNAMRTSANRTADVYG